MPSRIKNTTGAKGRPRSCVYTSQRPAIPLRSPTERATHDENMEVGASPSRTYAPANNKKEDVEVRQHNMTEAERDAPQSQCTMGGRRRTRSIFKAGPSRNRSIYTRNNRRRTGRSIGHRQARHLANTSVQDAMALPRSATKILSVWGQLIIFFYFHFLCLIWHVIKRYG